MPKLPGLDEIPRISLSKIKPSEANPRKIPESAVDAVAKSLSRFGWQQPIVVDNEGVILVGHTRRLAALSLGETEAPVVTAANLTAEEARAYRIADNRAGEYSRWEYDALAQQLAQLDDDLADVLGVAEWDSVMAGLEAVQSEAQEIPGLTESAAARLNTAVEYTIVFNSQELADNALPGLARLEGVSDIRAKQ